MSRFGVPESELPSDAALRRWHPAFALDTSVPEVEPAPLPPRPLAYAGAEEKITSAREAVSAFRARALFKEAALCEKLIPASPSPPTPVEAVTPHPPKPTSSAASHLKGVSASLLAKVRIYLRFVLAGSTPRWRYNLLAIVQLSSAVRLALVRFPAQAATQTLAFKYTEC